MGQPGKVNIRYYSVVHCPVYSTYYDFAIVSNMATVSHDNAISEIIEEAREMIAFI